MNKEVVLEMVNEVILDKIVQMIEGMSTNEFVEEITDKLIEGGVPIDTENEDEMEEIKDLIGSRVLPLLHKMSEYLIGKNIPIE
jgi:hypothetical protein